MAVDPQIQGMLDLLEHLAAPALSSLPHQEARDGFEQMTVGMRAVGMLTPVSSTRDIAIPGPIGAMKARVYRPEVLGTEPLPTVLFVHGGGFVVGSVETHDNQARGICKATNSVVVSIDYQLAPESRWPVPVDETYAALRWVADHIDEFGNDPAHLAIAGDSAGGNLAAVAAQLAAKDGPPVCAQFLIYPATDFDPDADYPSRVENATGYFLTTEDMTWFSGHYVPEGSDLDDPRLSPLRSPDLADLPPTIVLTAEYDPLRDEGEAYAAALEKAGVDVQLMRSDGLIHGFFDLGMLSAGAAKAVDIGCAAFSDLLHRSPAA